MRSSNRSPTTLFAFLGVFVAGCVAPVADAADDESNNVAASQTTQAIVLVERTASESTGDGQFVQTNVSAKFMRLGANADLDMAERVVGGSWLDLPAAGECRALGSSSGTDETATLSGLGAIELLDIGDLSIKAEATSMPLATRAFPDVGGLISGVFYTSRDARSDLPAPGRYVLESTGSNVLDKFSTDADAPANPEGVRIGSVDLSEGVFLEENAATNLTWRVSDKPEDDRIYVDLTAPSGAGVRCTYKDLGEGILPASATTSKVWGTLPAVVTVAVHRTRTRPFNASGIDDAELRFDFSMVGKATIAAPNP